MLLSICLFTHNQLDLLRKNISQIIKYKGNDIEIVVSDDHSTDPIEEMVSSFDDDRIRYCKLVENSGVDYNIINGLRNCKGEYVFVFRTKDIIIPSKISEVIKIVRRFPHASYFLFSAKDERYGIRMSLPDKVYSQGESAQNAHAHLLMHPSGHVYKRSCLRLELYERYFSAYVPPNTGDNIHQIIRMDLSVQGDFVTSSCLAWRYAYTVKSKEKSVIVTCGRVDTSAPVNRYPHYICELNFVDKELSSLYSFSYIKQIMKTTILYLIPEFIIRNKDQARHNHYGFVQISFSPYGELLEFRKQTLKFIYSSQCNKKWELKLYLLWLICKTAVYDIPVTYTKHFLNNIIK